MKNDKSVPDEIMDGAISGLVAAVVKYWRPMVLKELDRAVREEKRRRLGFCTQCKGDSPNRCSPGQSICSACEENDEIFWNESVAGDFDPDEKKSH